MANDTIRLLQLKRGAKNALETILKGDKKPLAGVPIWESDTCKLKVGNGIDDYVNLPYISARDPEETNLVIIGWYKDNNFYKEESCINTYPKYVSKIYYDKFTTYIYYFSTDGLYHRLVQECQVDSNLPGLVKLYGQLGNNTDGSITQAFFTEKYEELLYDKIGIDTTELDGECVGFVVTTKPEA